MTRELVSALESFVDNVFFDGQMSTAALDAAGLTLAERLTDLPDLDPRSWYVLARLYMVRYFAMPGGQQLHDLQRMALAFTRVNLEAPSLVPEAAWNDWTSDLLRDARATDDTDLVGWTVKLLEMALDYSSPERANHAAILSNLSVALRAQYRHTGVSIDLDRAVEAAQRVPLPSPRPITPTGLGA